jgi:hypothetical protein
MVEKLNVKLNFNISCKMSNEVFVMCPHCERMTSKPEGCNYVFACGETHGGFQVGLGCGKPFCYECGKKFCTQKYDPKTGKEMGGYLQNHTSKCCKLAHGFDEDEYCPGGHNSHCNKRW